MGISKIKPLTSQYHSVGGSRGRGLLCLAPQLVISGFCGHIAISDCRSLLQSLADTFFELCMVVNPRFAVGISTLSLVVSAIKYFRFRRPFPVVDHHWNRLHIVSSSSPWSKTYGCRWNFDDICHTFGDVSTSGFGGHCYFRLSAVFEITVFKIAVVDSLGFAVDKKQI